MAVFDGALRVGIDWENVGIVSYHTLPATLPNLWLDPLYHTTTYIDPGTGTLAKIINTANDQFKAQTGVLLLQFTSAFAQNSLLIGSNGSNKNVPVNPSTEYTLSAWVSGTDTGSHTLQIQFFRTSDSTWVVGDSTTFVGPDFTKKTLTATSPSTATHIRVVIQRPNNSVSEVINVWGIFLTASSLTNHPIYFNAGTSYYTTTFGYDDITADVISFNSSLGKTNWNDVLPTDGKLTIVLRNDSKRYSPDYTSSPLYTFLKPNCRIFVKVDSSTNGIDYPLWSGWINEISVSPNIYGDRTVTITAHSGMDKLQDLFVIPFIGTGTTNSYVTVAQKIIEGGWDTPYYSGFIKLGVSKLNGGLLYNPIQLILNDGDSGNVSVYGYNWLNENAADIMGELSDVFGGYITQTRSGILKIRTKTGIDAASYTNFNYSDFLMGNEVVYGGDIYTQLEFEREITNFETDSYGIPHKLLKSPLRIDLNAGETKTLSIDFDFNDPLDISLGGVAITGISPPDLFSINSGILLFKTSDNTQQSFPLNINIGTSLNEKYLYAEKSNTFNNVRFYTGCDLTIKNNYAFGVYLFVDVVSNIGRIKSTQTPPERIIIGDTLTFGLIKQAIKNRFINTVALLNSYFSLKVSRAQVKKWFTKLDFAIKDSTTLTRMTQREQLHVIRLSETQTAISNLHQVIIGERMQFTPQYLEKSWILGPKV